MQKWTKCLYWDKSTGLRTEIAEANLDYNSMTVSEEGDTLNSSKS